MFAWVKWEMAGLQTRSVELISDLQLDPERIDQNREVWGN